MIVGPVPVTVMFSDEGLEGAGWYAWETEYPDEGYVLFSDVRPSVDDVKAIDPSYVPSFYGPTATYDPHLDAVLTPAGEVVDADA